MGMGWQISPDDEERPFKDRVDRALKHFRKKHDWTGPVVVYVHPDEIEDYTGDLVQVVAAPALGPGAVPKKSYRIEKGAADENS